MWDTIFGAANILAMIAWAVLILLPRPPVALSAVLFIGCGLLCLAYTGLLLAILTGMADPAPLPGAPGTLDFSSIAGVRGFFLSDGGVTLGWIHYLAFDLFVGLWIARDGDAKGFSRWVQAPVLALTYLVGPVGLFVWLVIREARARKSGWKRGKVSAG